VSRPLPVVSGCWRAVGVEGDRSCPELLRVVHCRNCQVFADEAARLFERPAPAGYTEQWTRNLGEEPPPMLDAGSTSAVVFRIEDEWLGLPTQAAAFVASEVSLRQLAGRSNRIFAGLCLFLGELTLAVSLRGLLGLGPPREGVRWLAMGAPAERWVFDIDELRGVVRFPESARSNAPTAMRSSVESYLSGVIKTPDSSFGLLDPRALNDAFLRSLVRAP
jgi:chemotaxis-related protein WspD